MVLRIYEAGEFVLRQAARELEPGEIVSAEIQELIASMYETMRAAPGVGLAAPQIGLPLRIAVIEDRQEYIDKSPPEKAAERERVAVAPHVIINPRLTLLPRTTDPSACALLPRTTEPSACALGLESGTVEFFEGCLSLPGFTAMVPRARAVTVECLNERAEPVTIRAQGWYARILQHEIDHLNGTLYIDRMLTRSFMNRENFERYWKEVPVDEVRRRIGPGAGGTD